MASVDSPPTPARSDLREFIEPLWARKTLIAVIVVLTTSAVYFYYASRPQTWSASTQLFLEPTQVDALISGTPSQPGSDRTAQNLAELARTRGVAALAARRLGDGRTPDAILDQISVTATTGTDFLDVVATDSDPVRAARTANAFAAAFTDSRTQAFRTRLRGVVEQTRKQLKAVGGRSSAAGGELRDRLSRLEPLLALPSADIRQLDPAQPPRAPVAPKPLRNAVFGFGISLVLALFAAFGLARFDVRVRRISDVEQAYSLPLLGTIPHLEATPARGGEQRSARAVHPAAEEPVRSLHTALRLYAIDRPLKTLLVTSAVPGEGKSTLIRNLAMVMRDAGDDVVVVEADLRRPVLREWFGLARAAGLTDVLAGTATLEQALQRPEPPQPAAPSGNGAVSTLTPVGRLAVLASGPTPPNPTAVLASKQMARLMATVAADADYVLVDAPPLLPVSDALSLLAAVDAVIVVSRVGVTYEAAAKRLTQLLERSATCDVIGVVANDVAEDQFGSGYGYTYNVALSGGARD